MADQAPKDDVFEFADKIPEAGNPTRTADLTCVTCGKPIEYSGRGPKPKYCDDHRRTRKTSGGAAKNSAVVTRAIDELDVMYSMLGQGVSMRYPLPGKAIHESSRDLAESYRMLLETNAKFRKLFVDVESKAAWLPIVLVHGKIAATIYAGIQAQAEMERAKNSTDDETENVDVGHHDPL